MKLKNVINLFILSVLVVSCTPKEEHGASNEAPQASSNDINYQIMVQRATQTAIWAMPGVALVDFIKSTRRDLGGDYEDVLYLNKPLDSKQQLMMLRLMLGVILL